MVPGKRGYFLVQNTFNVNVHIWLEDRVIFGLPFGGGKGLECVYESRRVGADRPRSGNGRLKGEAMINIQKLLKVPIITKQTI